MAKLIMRAVGMNGQIELMDDRVVIHRKGILNMFKYGINTRKEIPLSAISTINFRDANIFKFGEIGFAYAGRSQVDNREDNVAFARKKQQEFHMLKEKMFALMQQQGRK